MKIRKIVIRSIPIEQTFFGEREIQLIEKDDDGTECLISSLPCTSESIHSDRIRDWLADGAVANKSFLRVKKNYLSNPKKSLERARNAKAVH